MTARGCRHPAELREAQDDGLRVRCGHCGRVFVPAGAPVEHGTYRGYSRHKLRQRGEWAWPPGDGCGCAAAAAAWRREYETRPGTADSRRRRGRARMQAMERLRRVYPGHYARLYTEELEAAGGQVVRQEYEIPLWDDIIARLVKDALGVDEAAAADLVRLGRAGSRERAVLRHTARLRALLRYLTEGDDHDG